MTHFSPIGPHSQWVNQNYMQRQFIIHKSTAVIGQFDSGSSLEDIQVNLQMKSLHAQCLISIVQLFHENGQQSVITGLNKAKVLALLDRTLPTRHLDPFLASIKTC